MGMMRKLFRPGVGQVHESYAAFGVLAGETLNISESAIIRDDVTGVATTGEFADIGSNDYILIERCAADIDSHGGFVGVVLGPSVVAGNIAIPNAGDDVATTDSVVITQCGGVRTGAEVATAVSGASAHPGANGQLDDGAVAESGTVGRFLANASSNLAPVWLKPCV